MKTEHTPEPWERLDSRVYFPNLAGGFSLHNCPDAEANARRIVACVNACAGIGTEYLEHFGATTFNDFKRVKNQRDELLEANRIACEDLVERRDRIAELKQQRDELLESLRDTLDFVERHSNRWDGVNGKHPFTVVDAARAAIASVKEKS